MDLDSKIVEQSTIAYNDLIQKKRLSIQHCNYVNTINIDLKKAF